MKKNSENQDSVFHRAGEIIKKDTSISAEEKEMILKLLQILIESADSSPNSRKKTDQIKTIPQEVISKQSLMSVVKQQADELDALKYISLNLTSSLDLQTVLDAIVTEAMRLVKNASAANIFLYVGDKLDFGASLTSDGENKKPFSTPRNDDLAYDVAKSEKQIIIEDIENHPIYGGLDKNQVGSIVGIPLIFSNIIVGVMNISRSFTGGFTRSELRLIGLLADQAALAIQNAQIFGELIQTKDLLGARTALAWMGMVSSTWRHAIAKHAITIREQTELLRNDLAQTLESDRVDRRLDMIQRLANQILEKPMTAPLSSEEGVESVLVNSLITVRVKQLWAHEPYRNIMLETFLELEDAATIRASPEWLQRALDILIDNAVDAVSESPQPKINIATRSINNGVEIIVSDTGRGIPSEILKELFLIPIPSTNKLGLGLLFAQTIVRTYNGNIFCQATSPRGTTMAIWFPRANLKELSVPKSTLTHYGTSPIEYERLYNELRRAYDELKELDKKKTEFLSTVSHELRTPLTSVKSCIENLLSGMYGFLNEKQQSRLDIALSGAREESRLIENLLDLARIQEGKSVLELAQGDICKIIRDVAGVFGYDASQKDITITEELPTNEKIEMLVDAGKIKQVITNLVSNALKFTPEQGIITIRARNLDTHVEIQVKDTGTGIPEEEFQKIFDRFYQVDSSLTRKVGGTGIGLNIAKEYVEMHGGRIWVESSKVGEGTIFTFTLPVK